MSGKQLRNYSEQGSLVREQGKMAGILKGTAMLACIAALGACAASPVEQQGRIAAHETGRQSAPILALAESMAAQNRHAAAIPLYRQALSEQHEISDRARTYTGLANALIAVGQYAQAEETLFIAQRLMPQSSAVHLGLGEVNLAFGRPGLALENFASAQSYGNRTKALAGQGIALDALGRHTEALSAYESAVSASGSDLNLHNNLALSHALHDNADEAVSIMEKIVAQDGATPHHRQNLVLAYIFQGERDKAMKMASVDLDNRTARETISWFTELKALPPAERVKAMTAAALPAEKATPKDTAILVIEDTADKKIAGKRLVTAPEPPVKVANVPKRPTVVPSPEPVRIPEPEPELEDMPPLVDPEGWSVQVAAYRTAAQLVRGQKYYWATFNTILGPLEPRRSEVDFGNRAGTPSGFYYRLNAGPLRDLGQAQQVCGDLKAAGAPCWIRPPEPKEGRLPPS